MLHKTTLMGKKWKKNYKYELIGNFEKFSLVFHRNQRPQKA